PLVLTAVLLVAAAPSPLSGAHHSQRACAGAGPYWPTETLALTGGPAWVARKDESLVARLTLPTGKVRSTPLAVAPIAVVAGLGAVWALDSGGTVSRLDP